MKTTLEPIIEASNEFRIVYAYLIVKPSNQHGLVFRPDIRFNQALALTR